MGLGKPHAQVVAEIKKKIQSALMDFMDVFLR
jgi:hypothetical protein